jgi:hypothetical protein
MPAQPKVHSAPSISLRSLIKMLWAIFGDVDQYFFESLESFVHLPPADEDSLRLSPPADTLEPQKDGRR